MVALNCTPLFAVIWHNGYIFACWSPLIGDPDVPSAGAILRPALAKILAEKTKTTGANVRLGVTFTDMNQGADGVEVTFTDGTCSTYDLVIGADGLYSQVRKTQFPEAAEPKYVGQGVWRAVLPRLPEINNTMMWVGENFKAGLNPMSKDQMYMFVTQNNAPGTWIKGEEALVKLNDILQAFPAPLLQQARSMLNEDSHINYRPLENLLVPAPWYKNRIVLIGDTVHATTPHMAAGACIGIEDAIVLAEQLTNSSSLDEALSTFQDRRWERCRMVVENSARLAQIEMEDGDKKEHMGIMRDSHIALAQPI